MKVKRKKKSGTTKLLLRYADDPIRFWVKSRKRSSETKNKK